MTSEIVPEAPESCALRHFASRCRICRRSGPASAQEVLLGAWCRTSETGASGARVRGRERCKHLAPSTRSRLTYTSRAGLTEFGGGFRNRRIGREEQRHSWPDWYAA
eukprot:9607148-Alexandrium_andersonii.AAC.1